jgi:ankyrin repeat protein
MLLIRPPGCSLLQESSTPLQMQYFVTARALLEGVTWLLQAGLTALHGAADKGHTEVVEQLLAAGAAVDATSQVRPPHELARMGLEIMAITSSSCTPEYLSVLHGMPVLI